MILLHYFTKELLKILIAKFSRDFLDTLGLELLPCFAKRIDIQKYAEQMGMGFVIKLGKIWWIVFCFSFYYFNDYFGDTVVTGLKTSLPSFMRLYKEYLLVATSTEKINRTALGASFRPVSQA